MNPTRALGVLLLVLGVGWFLAVPTILPAAYHGHVHTGHRHSQYAARTIDPGVQTVVTITDASESAVDASPNHDWTAARASPLSETDRTALDDAKSGTANTTDPGTRDQYRRLIETHPYLHDEQTGWLELALTDTENYTMLGVSTAGTATVVKAIALSPDQIPGRTGTQARTLARSDGAVLVSAPALPTPLFLEHQDSLYRVVRVGEAPNPPPIPAFAMFLVPGVVFVLLGGFLWARS